MSPAKGLIFSELYYINPPTKIKGAKSIRTMNQRFAKVYPIL